MSDPSNPAGPGVPPPDRMAKAAAQTDTPVPAAALPPPLPPPNPPARGLPGALRSPWTIAAIVLAALLVWQWYDSRMQIGALRDELALRLHESDADSREARRSARQSEESVREAQAKLAQLDAKLAESQNQQVALEALYQELSRNRDESALAEIDQILTIASQQLQLAGNVQAAVAALQTADARLARGDRPQFIPLRKVLARDLDRLKAIPNIDVTGLTLKLDQASALVDSLPLVTYERMAAPAGTERPPSNSFWARFGTEVWDELRSLVRIQVMDRPDPGLVAPTQAFFLRENLKLRLLNARLALLARNERVFREDLKTAQAWVDRWFDARSPQTKAMQTGLKQLSAAAVQIEVPTIAESMSAVRNYKLVRSERGR